MRLLVCVLVAAGCDQLDPSCKRSEQCATGWVCVPTPPWSDIQPGVCADCFEDRDCGTGTCIHDLEPKYGEAGRCVYAS